MGIFDGLKNVIKDEAAKQFIARPDDAKDTIVYKWPETNIRLLSQLTVQADEVALFVKKGQVAGILTSGAHNLNGADIPFLGALIDNITGGNFLMSELYFVSTRQFANLPFGGMIDNVLDPMSNLAVGIRLFGEYSIKAIEPEKLVINLLGTKSMTTNDELTEWVKSLLLKVFREVVSSYVSEERKPVLGIASQASEFELKVLPLVAKELEEYGLTVAKIGNVTISIKEEDEATLKQMTRDFAYANNMQAADAAVKLGMASGLQNGSGAGQAATSTFGAATGFTMGMGMNAAQQMSQNQTNTSTSIPTTPAPTAPVAPTTDSK